MRLQLPDAAQAPLGLLRGTPLTSLTNILPSALRCIALPRNASPPQARPAPHPSKIARNLQKDTPDSMPLHRNILKCTAALLHRLQRDVPVTLAPLKTKMTGSAALLHSH